MVVSDYSNSEADLFACISNLGRETVLGVNAQTNKLGTGTAEFGCSFDFKIALRQMLEWPMFIVHNFYFATLHQSDDDEADMVRKYIPYQCTVMHNYNLSVLGFQRKCWKTIQWSSYYAQRREESKHVDGQSTIGIDFGTQLVSVLASSERRHGQRQKKKKERKALPVNFVNPYTG